MPGKRVLVVDDERSMLDLVAALLRRIGHVADTADTADQALRLLETTDFDLDRSS